MKSRFTLVALSLTAVLAMLLLMLSCGTGQQNQNQNQNVVGVQPTDIFDDKDPSCDETNIQKRREQAEINLNTPLGKDNQLKDGRIKVLVKVVDNKYLETLVEGEAKGDDELEDLSKIIRKFMKDECVLRVSFVPTGTLPAGTTTRSELFEWTACEHPKVPCNGVCEYPCARLSPTPSNSGPGATANADPSSNTGKGNN